MINFVSNVICAWYTPSDTHTHTHLYTLLVFQRNGSAQVCLMKRMPGTVHVVQRMQYARERNFTLLIFSGFWIRGEIYKVFHLMRKNKICYRD